jgi:hypothetical protein
MHQTSNPMTHHNVRLTPTESIDPRRERAAYEPPVLRRLGSVRELTLTGGASVTDGGGLGASKGGPR